MQKVNENELLSDYEKFVKHTQQFPQHVAQDYLVAGLMSEAGEVAGVQKRILRQDSQYNESVAQTKMLDELGDVLWYITSLCMHHNSSLEDLIKRNTAKLAQRLANNTIKGQGDDR
jgi:NTP pyrophosphatase (non-canonical NTP hydrolase)